jgi:hypothetical protein
MPDCQVVFARGVLVAAGPAVEHAVSRTVGLRKLSTACRDNRRARDGSAHHITLVTKDEVAQLLS